VKVCYNRFTIEKHHFDIFQIKRNNIMLSDPEMKKISELLFKMEGTDFNRVMGLFNNAQDNRQLVARNKFAIGDNVTFIDKNGDTIDGDVIKIMPANIKVRVGRVDWSVNPTVLSLAA
jgi:predicted double-glycine peptidase